MNKERSREIVDEKRIHRGKETHALIDPTFSSQKVSISFSEI